MKNHTTRLMVVEDSAVDLRYREALLNEIGYTVACTAMSGEEAVGKFANHYPPKDDTVLSTSRMFYAWSHPRRDREPPASIASPSDSGSEMIPRSRRSSVVSR